MDEGPSVLGVDFSGAENAGDSIWVAHTHRDGEGLTVDSCEPIRRRTGTAERGPCLDELRTVVRGSDAAGLDFSFGLPRAVHPCENWEAMVGWFRDEFDDVDAFVERCVGEARRLDDADLTYLKRATDEAVSASSPYFWIVDDQTFHGLTSVVGPLVDDPAVTFRPMQDGDGTQVCEVYPAGTLRRLGLPSERYKNDEKHPDAPSRRERIVAGLEATGVDFDGYREAVLTDSGGDALDSVVAAVATARAFDDDFDAGEYDSLEGHIYV